MADCIPIPSGTRLQDLTGMKFGKLEVVGYQGRSKWKCQCECGVIKDFVNGDNLRRGSVKSCKCAILEKITKHGLCKSISYSSWASMNSRCSNPKHASFPMYGGRGIKVCERWKNSFSDFYSDMGPRPSKKHTIDRFPNNDGGYEPGNCRWATPRQQINNRSNTLIFSVDGLAMPLSYWSELTGISSDRIVARIERGWSVDESICLPLQNRLDGYSRRRTQML